MPKRFFINLPMFGKIFSLQVCGKTIYEILFDIFSSLGKLVKCGV
jgi:hypothetical protein